MGAGEELSEHIGDGCLVVAAVKKEMGKGKRKFWVRAQAEDGLWKVETYGHLGLCHQNVAEKKKRAREWNLAHRERWEGPCPPAWSI